MREGIDRLRNACIAAGQQGFKPEQSFRIEGGKKIARYGRVDVAGPQIILNDAIWTVERRRASRRERLRLVGQVRERGQSEDGVDRLDHRVVVAFDMGDGMNARIGEITMSGTRIPRASGKPSGP